MDMDLVLKIMLALVTLMGAILTGLVIPYIRTKTTLAERETALAKTNEALRWIRFAMLAAEEIFKLPKSGAEKKAYVIEFLKGKGIELTTEELNVLIESLVMEINNVTEELIEE